MISSLRLFLLLLPTRVESIDKSDRAKGPRIISLVLVVFTCMSLRSKEYHMKINTKATKIMCISSQGNQKVRIIIDGKQVEQVNRDTTFID